MFGGPIKIRPTAPSAPPPPPSRSRTFSVRDTICWLQRALDQEYAPGHLQVLTDGRDFYVLAPACSGENYLVHACEPASTIAELALNLRAESYRVWTTLGDLLDGIGPAAWAAIREAQ